MKTYVFFEQKTGRILETITAPLQVAVDMAERLDASIYIPSAGEDYPWNRNFYIDTKLGKAKAKPPAPSESHYWDYNNKSWQVDISKYREEVWSHIKTFYRFILDDGLEWRGYVFDFDKDSQTAITQAAQMASIDATRAFNWTLKDNTVIALDAAEMIDVATTMYDKLQEIHDTKESLREQVFSTYREQVLKDLIPKEK